MKYINQPTRQAYTHKNKITKAACIIEKLLFSSSDAGTEHWKFWVSSALYTYKQFFVHVSQFYVFNSCATWI